MKFRAEEGCRDLKNVEILQGSDLKNAAVDAIGPLPKDEDGNQSILVIVDEFRKFAWLAGRWRHEDVGALLNLFLCLG
jgi:hypothetical protein